MSGKGKNNEPKTLLTLLQALQGKHVAIDLRSDIEASGVIKNVDHKMNITLSDAQLRFPFMGKKESEKLDILFIKGTNLLYVHIPSSLNVGKLIDQHVYGREAGNKRKISKANMKPRPEEIPDLT